MEIKRVNKTMLQNMEHFQFAQHVVAMCREANIEKLNEMLAPLQAVLAEEDKALNVPRLEEGTQELRALDEKRDTAYRSVQLVVELHSNSEDAATRASAEKLNRLLRAYPDVLRVNYDKETGLLKNLIADLRDAKVAADIAKLGALNYVNRLDNANKDFDARYRSRLKSAVPTGTFDIKKLRADTDKALNAVIRRMDSLDDLEPTTTGLAELITQYNALVDKKRQLLAQRVAANKNAKGRKRAEYSTLLAPLLPAFEKQLGLKQGALSFSGVTQGMAKKRLYQLNVNGGERQIWVQIVKDRLVQVETKSPDKKTDDKKTDGPTVTDEHGTHAVVPVN